MQVNSSSHKDEGSTGKGCSLAAGQMLEMEPCMTVEAQHTYHASDAPASQGSGVNGRDVNIQEAVVLCYSPPHSHYGSALRGAEGCWAAVSVKGGDSDAGTPSSA